MEGGTTFYFATAESTRRWHAQRSRGQQRRQDWRQSPNVAAASAAHPFHFLTSHATWLKMAGADVKDAQAQMRHSRSSTTLDVYQQFVPESQQRAVDRLSRLAN
jgi:integrase